MGQCPNLYRSYPAAIAEPRVGMRAFSECFLILRLSEGRELVGFFNSEVAFRFLFCGSRGIEGSDGWGGWVGDVTPPAGGPY